MMSYNWVGIVTSIFNQDRGRHRGDVPEGGVTEPAEGRQLAQVHIDRLQVLKQ